VARFAKARWRGPVPNRTPNGTVKPIMGVVLHIQCGTEEGTNSWFHNKMAKVSAHFGNPRRWYFRLDQWVDTKDKAWAEAAGNPNWISLENEGKAGQKLTRGQIKRAAQLLVWVHRKYGAPIRISNNVNRGGLIGHSCGGAAWGGHTSCPGPRIMAQRSEIIAKARKIMAKQEKRRRLCRTGLSVTYAAMYRART
jgi:hypothetical protein